MLYYNKTKISTMVTKYMKRHHRRRHTIRRRRSLKSTIWGPILALSATIIGVAGIIAAIVFVGLPRLLPLIGIDYRAPFAPTPTPSPTPRPTPTPNPMELFDAEGAETEVVFDEIRDYKWFGDPYFYGGKLMLTGGKLIDGKAIMCDLLLWDPEGRSAQKLNIPLENTHFMFPKFNDDWIVYLDANYDGGGKLCAVDRSASSLKPVTIKTVYTGQCEPMLYQNYVAWTERTGTRMDKLFLCDLTTMETTTLHMFSNTSYGQSLPSLMDGVLVWADAERSGSTDEEDVSVIYSVRLGSASIQSIHTETYAHDPISNGQYTAWLDAHHSLQTKLYCMAQGASEPTLVAQGVVQFGMGNKFIAYSKDETIYLYRFDNKKTYKLSGEYEKAQFMGVSDGKVIWMDVTSRERDILKYSEVPER